MSNLTVRILFAIPAMALFFFLMYFNYWTRVGALSFILVVGSWEFGKMIRAKFNGPRVDIVLPLLMLALNLTQFIPTLSCYTSLVTMVSVFTLILLGYKSIDIDELFPWLAQVLLGFALLGFWTAQGFEIISAGDMSFEGAYVFLFTAMVMWASDSFAYFAGRTLGKNKMAPQISPKKTWEGSIGGVIGVIVLVYFVGPAMTGLDLVPTLLLGLILSIAGQIGDLFFSAMKRYTGVKDSSNIFPGHGGVLDRFDSFILGLPLSVIIIAFFK
tara:strand:+ start:2226 stop:3038 length:813 start_codon:yes stop_codon:yes gene_type:complete